MNLKSILSCLAMAFALVAMPATAQSQNSDILKGGAISWTRNGSLVTFDIIVYFDRAAVDTDPLSPMQVGYDFASNAMISVEFGDAIAQSLTDFRVVGFNDAAQIVAAVPVVQTTSGKVEHDYAAVLDPTVTATLIGDFISPLSRNAGGGQMGVGALVSLTQVEQSPALSNTAKNYFGSKTIPKIQGATFSVPFDDHPTYGVPTHDIAAGGASVSPTIDPSSGVVTWDTSSFEQLCESFSVGASASFHVLDEENNPQVVATSAIQFFVWINNENPAHGQNPVIIDPVSGTNADGCASPAVMFSVTANEGTIPARLQIVYTSSLGGGGTIFQSYGCADATRNTTGVFVNNPGFIDYSLTFIAIDDDGRQSVPVTVNVGSAAVGATVQTPAANPLSLTYTPEGFPAFAISRNSDLTFYVDVASCLGADVVLEEDPQAPLPAWISVSPLLGGSYSPQTQTYEFQCQPTTNDETTTISLVSRDNIGSNRTLRVKLKLTNGPAWWMDKNVVTGGAPEGDYAMATKGQLRSIAKKAYDVLLARYGAGLGSDLHGVMITLNQDNGRNYEPLAQGQLKHVGKIFYDELTDQNAWPQGQYPWTFTNSNDNKHTSPATVGQVKRVFSFPIPGP